jgi:hypothetical protein
VTVLRDLKRSVLLFHSGLAVFSLLPALTLFLLLAAAVGKGWVPLSSGLAVIALFQLLGILYRAGAFPGALPLRLSYWTLKMIQSLHLISEYTPEKVVVVMNNRKVLAATPTGFSPDRTLILLPHCLQSHQCTIRLTYDPDGCERCGRCPIGSLLDIRDRFGTHFAIASGGTSARRIVEKIRPTLIVAVACPIDLSLGILDVQPITTVGVLNQWRSGPCYDTWVDSRELEAALVLFLGGGGT